MSGRAVCVLAVALLAIPPARAQKNDKQDFELIQRGRYLATVGDCTACHTVPGGKFLAGGRSLETPFGQFGGTKYHA